MNQENKTLLLIAAHSLKFTTDHPYAATGILGAAIGSAVTYKLLTAQSLRASVTKVVTPKVYELAIPEADLRHMLVDPTAEVRWDMPTISVIVVPERKEHLKQLPDIEI